MSKRDDCGITPGYEGGVFCTNCKPLTNAARIRGMSDEELAEYHTEMCGCPPGHDPIFCGMATIGCKGCWLNWLREEAET